MKQQSAVQPRGIDMTSRVARDPRFMSSFAPRIVGRLARICSAYDALFESFGLPQKSHYNAARARKCRQTVDKLTCRKSMVGGIPRLRVVPHVGSWRPRPVLVT